ncbi:MAG: hypothetical protein RLZZ203_2228 [Cyanobacteriota bacterium]
MVYIFRLFNQTINTSSIINLFTFFNLLTRKQMRKNSGEVKRSPTPVINLSFMDAINKRSRGSGYERAL